MLIRVQQGISIHAPHAGRDFFPFFPIRGRDNFNPRAPCGARRALQASIGRSNTISIHAPHAGRDSPCRKRLPTRRISIHAPHAGRDGVIWDSWDSSNEFQSTRPMRGATFAHNSILFSKRFQSTRPMRGATPTAKRRPPDCQGFQSTRPMRGATLDDLQPYKTVKISIHAPHAGRDLLSISPMPATMTFQSTRPMRGATRYTDHRAVERERFQSTRPMRGATRSGSDTIHFVSDFNPRAPCGARRNLIKDRTVTKVFQSTRPMRGATFPGYVRYQECQISIHAPHAGRDVVSPII